MPAQDLPEDVNTGSALFPIKEPSVSDGLSHTLIKAMERHLGRGELVLLFLNRRGFAPVLVCFCWEHRWWSKDTISPGSPWLA